MGRSVAYRVEYASRSASRLSVQRVRKVELVMGVLQAPLQIRERLQSQGLELRDPALVDLLQWHGVE